MKTPILSVLLLVACASKAPAPVDTWLPTTPGAPDLCLPAPQARLSKADRVLWVQAAEAAAAGRPEEADAALALSETPSLQQPSAWIVKLQRSMAEASELDGLEADAAGLRAAAELAPDDACMQYTAGMSSLLAGDDGARPFLHRAQAAMPDRADPTAALMLLDLREGQLDEAALAAAVERFPQDASLAFLLATVHLRAGRFERALPLLVKSKQAGVEIDDVLFIVSRLAGDLDRYLAMAPEHGAPPGMESIAEAPSPQAALRTSLGVAADGSLPAHIETSEGSLRCDLLWQEAPITVSHFVGLARGTQPFTEPDSGETVTRPYYDGTVLHRVIPGFMIQGGDPTGTGAGGPGYRFLDEITPTRSFDRPGLLAMANAGPGTNGSQFFVTEVPVTYLDGKHTIFGVCDQASVDVVKRIARVPRDAQDKPQTDVVVEGITIGSQP